jgi:hypothetical protein
MSALWIRTGGVTRSVPGMRHSRTTRRSDRRPVHNEATGDEEINAATVEIDDFVSFLCANSIRCEPRPTLWPLANDPGDEFLARLAVTAGSDYVVTHNQRHFQALRSAGISVVTPGRFLSIIRVA